jgi:hypothetical protein
VPTPRRAPSVHGNCSNSHAEDVSKGVFKNLVSELSEVVSGPRFISISPDSVWLELYNTLCRLQLQLRLL